MTIIKNFETKEKRGLPKKVWIVSLGLIFLVILEIWVYNTTTEFGYKFDSISKDSQNLILENAILENEIAKQSSLISVASQSALLGFKRTSVIQYLR